MELLKIQNLNFKYSDEKILFNNASLNINKGEVVGLIGPNGSGKTTLLKILSNIIITDIRLSFLEKDNTLIKDNIKNIGYIPDKPFLYDYLTGEENIDYIMNIFKEDKSIFKKKVLDLCKKFGLENDLNQEVRKYSLGMKHKLYLSIILSREVVFILMDEPLTSLDKNSIDVAIKAIKELCKKGISILLSSHVKQVIEDLSDRILTIKDTKIIEGKKFDYEKEVFYENSIK